MMGEPWAAHCRLCAFAGVVVVMGVAGQDPRALCTPCPERACAGYVQLLAPLDVFRDHELCDSVAHAPDDADGSSASAAMRRWTAARMWETWPAANSSRYLAVITCEGQGSANATLPDLHVIG